MSGNSTSPRQKSLSNLYDSFLRNCITWLESVLVLPPDQPSLPSLDDVTKSFSQYRERLEAEITTKRTKKKELTENWKQQCSIVEEQEREIAVVEERAREAILWRWENAHIAPIDFYREEVPAGVAAQREVIEVAVNKVFGIDKLKKELHPMRATRYQLAVDFQEEEKAEGELVSSLKRVTVIKDKIETLQSGHKTTGSLDRATLEDLHLSCKAKLAGIGLRNTIEREVLQRQPAVEQEPEHHCNKVSVTVGAS